MKKDIFVLCLCNHQIHFPHLSAQFTCTMFSNQNKLEQQGIHVVVEIRICDTRKLRYKSPPIQDINGDMLGKEKTS